MNRPKKTAKSRNETASHPSYKEAKQQGLAFDPAEVGFEFSSAEIAARVRQQDLEAAVKCGRHQEYKKKGWLQAA